MDIQKKSDRFDVDAVWCKSVVTGMFGRYACKCMLATCSYVIIYVNINSVIWMEKHKPADSRCALAGRKLN